MDKEGAKFVVLQPGLIFIRDGMIHLPPDSILSRYLGADTKFFFFFFFKNSNSTSIVIRCVAILVFYF